MPFEQQIHQNMKTSAIASALAAVCLTSLNVSAAAIEVTYNDFSDVSGLQLNDRAATIGNAVTDDQGRLCGIFTDGDLRRAIGPTLLTSRLGEVMTAAPRTIGPDFLAAEALHIMNAPERPITALFVVDAAQRPLGILHIHDLLRAGVA